MISRKTRQKDKILQRKKHGRQKAKTEAMEKDRRIRKPKKRKKGVRMIRCTWDEMHPSIPQMLLSLFCFLFMRRC
jgi:hypothetical protein